MTKHNGLEYPTSHADGVVEVLCAQLLGTFHGASSNYPEIMSGVVRPYDHRKNWPEGAWRATRMSNISCYVVQVAVPGNDNTSTGTHAQNVLAEVARLYTQLVV